MSQSHYSLRWNNHQSHILSAFDALLQAETLVDVTLVCAETSVRAHKVVLSACSPFFQRIFSENPCKHPVIVLKDFSGWEVQAIVDFMYKGEISVGQEQLQSLIKAAESLQVRGLAQQEHLGVEKETRNETTTPSGSPNDFTFGRFPTPGTTVRAVGERQSPFSPLPGPNYEPPLKLPHMTHPSFSENLMPSRHECSSPLPRRKQARPRRRSGELCGPQDLSSKPSSSPQPEETAENLCVKKPIKVETPTKLSQELIHNQQNQQQSSQQQHHSSTNHHNSIHHESHRTSVKTERSEPSSPPELDLSMPDKEYLPSPPLSLPPVLGLHHDHIDSHSPLPFPPMPSISALAMTPPQSKCKYIFFHIFKLRCRYTIFRQIIERFSSPIDLFYHWIKKGRLGRLFLRLDTRCDKKLYLQSPTIGTFVYRPPFVFSNFV